MANAVIVDAVRTPGGKRGGKLKDWHPVDLAAEVLKEIVKRNNLDPGLVDDVIMGCVSQTGEQSINIGRNALLAAGFPEAVPGITTANAAPANRLCTSPRRGSWQVSTTSSLPPGSSQ